MASCTWEPRRAWLCTGCRRDVGVAWVSPLRADSPRNRRSVPRSREEKEKNYYYQERTYQALQRALKFPAEVKADLAAANLKDGVLEVRVPKKEPTAEPKPVKVPVE